MLLAQLHRVAEHKLHFALPVVPELVRRQLALLAAVGMDRKLKPVHGGLARDRGERAFDLFCVQSQLVFERSRLNSLLENKHLAERGRKLGQRQGAVKIQQGLLAGQRRMDAMAQLMRERHHVLHAA